MWIVTLFTFQVFGVGSTVSFFGHYRVQGDMLEGASTRLTPPARARSLSPDLKD